MFKLYIKLYSICYDSLISYNKDISNPKSWNEKRKIYNKKINKKVFKFLKDNELSKKKISDQFILDMINYFLYSSFKIRKFFLFNNKFLVFPKFIFIIFCLINNLYDGIRIVSRRIYHTFFNSIKFPNKNLYKKAALIIGFPDYSFSKSIINSNYDSSLIEYLFNNKLINRKTDILSFDEYSLKKLSKIKSSKKIVRAQRQKRFLLKRVKTINFSFKVFYKVIINCLIMIRNFGFQSFSFYCYYIAKRLRTIELTDLFKRIEKRYNFYNIIFISTYDLGNLKYYNDKFLLYYQFNYSRNNIYPFSKNVLFNELNKTNNLELKNIIEEVELDNFTLSYPNSIGFTYHAYFYSFLRQIVNKKFKIKLLNQVKFPPKNEFYSNLGFAFEEKIKLNNYENNIIIYDVLAETQLDNISRRGIYGMFTQLNQFIENYIKEILYVLNQKKIKIYYKGKYSNNNEKKTLFLKTASELKIRFYNINEYSKINLIDKVKFNYAISQPFTSSFFNLASITKKSIYYVPNDFVKFFPQGINGVCYGSKELFKLLN